MRTTISISDEVYSEAKEILGTRPFSEFASDAIRTRIQQLKREHLAQKMVEGHQAEAEDSSLDVKWAGVEAEGL